MFKEITDFAKRNLLKLKIKSIMLGIPEVDFNDSLNYKVTKVFLINDKETEITLNYSKKRNIVEEIVKTEIIINKKSFNLNELLNLKLNENGSKILEEILPNLLNEMKEVLTKEVEEKNAKELINNLQRKIFNKLDKLKISPETIKSYKKTIYVRDGDPRMWDTNEGNKEKIKVIEYKGKDVTLITSVEELKEINKELDKQEEKELIAKKNERYGDLTNEFKM